MRQRKGVSKMRRSVKYGLSGAVIAGVVVTAGTAFAYRHQRNCRHPRGRRSVPLTFTPPQLTSKSALNGAGYTINLARHRRPVRRPRRSSRARRSSSSVDVCSTSTSTASPRTSGRRLRRFPTPSSALGYSQAEFVSVSRSTRLPLSVTSLTLRGPKTIKVVHDGKTWPHPHHDCRHGVGQVLSDLKITLGAHDT